jgi:hypothetical protein
MIMNKEELERKLKRERVEACLNCKKFVRCNDIGKCVECGDFREVEGEAWVIKRLGDSDTKIGQTR